MDLEHALAGVAGTRNLADARLVALVSEAVATDAWQGAGIRSVGHWLTIQLGCSPSFAHRVHRVAARRHELPTLFGLFEAGQLSLDVVEVAVRLAPSWADEQLPDFARYATVRQFTRELMALVPAGVDTPPPNAKPVDEPDAPSAGTNREHFSARWTADGRFVGSFDLGADTGMVLEAALDERRDALFAAGSTVTNADALRAVADRSLAAADPARRQRHLCMVHIDVTDAHLAARLSNGVRLPQPLREYLTCDADLQPVWERDHTPIGVGRSTRTIPTKLRRIIEHRDQGCRVPSCSNTRHIEIHHIIHWRNGGPTETWNLVSLCAQHHRMHHHGRLGIAGDPDAPGDLAFTDELGAPIPTGPRPRPPDQLREPDHPYEHPSGGRLTIDHLDGFIDPDHYRRCHHDG